MKKLSVILALFLIVLVAPPWTCFALSGNGVTIETTLTDGEPIRSSKKTFDVIARDRTGKKTFSEVFLDGEKVEPTWDDCDKTSFTLVFSDEGAHKLRITSELAEINYTLNYIKAKKGEEIGKAVWSVELFTIGNGFLIYPVEEPVYEGETSADGLLRLLKSKGFVGYYGGDSKSAFYLAYIANGDKSAEKFNGYKKSETPDFPLKLDIATKIPALLRHELENSMTFFDENDYEANSEGILGEFVYSNGSGWMYSVNNVFPNVGFSDFYLSDGDVVRVQFTLGYGADIGGTSALGGDGLASGYFETANKDKLIELFSRITDNDALSSKEYKNAESALFTLNSTQKEVDTAHEKLKKKLSEKPAETTITTSSTTTTTVAATVKNTAETTSTTVQSTTAKIIETTTAETTSAAEIIATTTPVTAATTTATEQATSVKSETEPVSETVSEPVSETAPETVRETTPQNTNGETTVKKIEADALDYNTFAENAFPVAAGVCGGIIISLILILVIKVKGKKK